MKSKPTVLKFPIHCADVYFLQRRVSSSGYSVTDWEALRRFKETFNWDVSISSLLARPYEALVVTDRHQTIRWVNEGFSAMTGYSPSEILHQKPDILQGKETSLETKGRIRTKLAKNEPFDETIVNYRRNGEKYICQITIYPIHNRQGDLQHFLALETELV
ncbi:MAG: PAS domain-containing protein [Cyclobacteriaceae bacterium]